MIFELKPHKKLGISQLAINMNPETQRPNFPFLPVKHVVSREALHERL